MDKQYGLKAFGIVSLLVTVLACGLVISDHADATSGAPVQIVDIDDHFVVQQFRDVSPLPRAGEVLQIEGLEPARIVKVTHFYEQPPGGEMRRGYRLFATFGDFGDEAIPTGGE